MMSLENYLNLIFKISPLYILLVLGIMAQRLQVETASISKIVIYYAAPFVIFNGVRTLPEATTYFYLPLLTAFISALCCSISFLFAPEKNNSNRPLFSFISGSSNSGYFGIPLAVILLGPQSTGKIILLSFGQVLYEYLIGPLALSPKNSTKAISLKIKKLLTLPALHALLLGFIFNYYHVELPKNLESIFQSFVGVYTVLGMMLVGLSLGRPSPKNLLTKLSFKMGLFFIIIRFILWPLIIILVIKADQKFFHLIPLDFYHPLLLLGLVPFGANGVAFAKEFHLDDKAASSLIFVGTILALFTIPLFFSVLEKMV